jgi:hypothetical protein
MNIEEKIDTRDELDTEIDDFFSEVCKYYLEGTPTWTMNRSYYGYNSYEYYAPGVLEITVSTGHGIYEVFKVSSDILRIADWKPIVDRLFLEEKKELNAKTAVSLAKTEAREREQFEILDKKYGITK